ncbi:SapC family protein [Oleiagrimonas soli]|uniref:Multidrug transporter n=1 Tax=Oleiagrimonas soli TaxID=1543381 RepID=A0A099CYF8_9GAMM|nr:SapC family protein [Oleiagrimonas soli]KGI78035.1 hypothetical protein LF63_0106565 [Oleiagrimonas soli]MBB6183572.1 hypothetical protein [Oleiagrimonas soli]
MKQVLVYERPVPIHRSRHRNLRVRPSVGEFSFARQINSVPLVGSEFAAAARDFPIVFAGASTASMMPAALLGLTQDENLFVEADGRWADEVYVPAFLRRYPFVVAEHATGEDLTVCVDEAAIDDADDALPLFQADGSESPMLRHAIEFLGEYQKDVQRTRAFMEQFAHHKLLVEKVIRLERPGNEPATLSGFSILDETRLNALGAKSLQTLAKSGALGLAYVHLMSLTNVQRLSARMDRKHKGTGGLH